MASTPTITYDSRIPEKRLWVTFENNKNKTLLEKIANFCLYIPSIAAGYEKPFKAEKLTEDHINSTHILITKVVCAILSIIPLLPLTLFGIAFRNYSTNHQQQYERLRTLNRTVPPPRSDEAIGQSPFSKLTPIEVTRRLDLDGPETLIGTLKAEYYAADTNTEDFFHNLEALCGAYKIEKKTFEVWTHLLENAPHSKIRRKTNTQAEIEAKTAKLTQKLLDFGGTSFLQHLLSQVKVPPLVCLENAPIEQLEKLKLPKENPEIWFAFLGSSALDDDKKEERIVRLLQDASYEQKIDIARKLQNTKVVPRRHIRPTLHTVCGAIIALDKTNDATIMRQLLDLFPERTDHQRLNNVRGIARTAAKFCPQERAPLLISAAANTNFLRNAHADSGTFAKAFLEYSLETDNLETIKSLCTAFWKHWDTLVKAESHYPKRMLESITSREILKAVIETLPAKSESLNRILFFLFGEYEVERSNTAGTPAEKELLKINLPPQFIDEVVNELEEGSIKKAIINVRKLLDEKG